MCVRAGCPKRALWCGNIPPSAAIPFGPAPAKAAGARYARARRSGKRQEQFGAGAALRAVRKRQPAAVQPGGLVGDGKAQAHVRCCGAARGVAGIEGLRPQAQSLGGKAGALVQHAKAQPAAVLPDGKAHKAVFGRGGNGVFHKVQHSAAQKLPGAGKRRRAALGTAC